MQQHDFKLGGPLFRWANPRDFNLGIVEDRTYRTVGWLRIKPKIGNLVLAEFERSWILFRVTDIDYPPRADPPDMFWANLLFVDQEMKDG